MSESKKEEELSQVILVFLLICVAFGLLVGVAGLGVGLVFLNVQQAFGIGILSIGCGALFGAMFGARRIMKATIETIRETEQEATASPKGQNSRPVSVDVAARLSSLKRYSVGSADEGGGYLYDYADESKNGEWVAWDDVKSIIDELTLAGRDTTKEKQ